jgi:hypothetical protein
MMSSLLIFGGGGVYLGADVAGAGVGGAGAFTKKNKIETVG